MPKIQFHYRRIGKSLYKYVEIDGQKWYTAYEICKDLKFTNGTKVALETYVYKNDYMRKNIGHRQLYLVNEIGLFMLIEASRSGSVMKIRRRIAKEYLKSQERNES